MKTESLDITAVNLTAPVNQALSQSDQGRFALMLSLLFETRYRQKGGESAEELMPAEAGRQLSLGMGQALHTHQWAHFALLTCLQSECRQPQEKFIASALTEAYQPQSGGFRERRGAGHDVAEEIEQSRRIVSSKAA